MTGFNQPIFLQLTEEQQAQLQRMSGRHTKVLELTPNPGDASSGTGTALHFRWRPSIATGIPRLGWGTADAAPATKPEE